MAMGRGHWCFYLLKRFDAQQVSILNFYIICLVLFAMNCSDDSLQSSSNSDDSVIYGCTDISSINFDSTATENDGSCIYCGLDTSFTSIQGGTAGYDITRSNNCSFVITGISGNKTILIKVNESGKELWNKKLGDVPGNHWGKSVRQTQDYGFIIGANQNTIIKTDSSGALEWFSKLSYSSNHFVEDVIETEDGDFIAVGGVGGDPIGGHNQKGQAFILKLSNGGNVQWVKRYGISDSPNDSFWGVVQSDDGGFVLAGEKLQSRNFEFYDHFWIMKTDQDGNMLWSHELGGNLWDEAKNIVKLSDDSYIAIGKKSLSSNNLNMWAIRFSTDGQILWNTHHGNNNYETGQSVSLSENEEVIAVAGYSRTSSGAPFNYRIWGLDVNNGKLLWDKVHGGVQEDEAYGIATGYDNGYMVVGKSYSFGNDRVNWLIKTNSVGEISN